MSRTKALIAKHISYAPLIALLWITSAGAQNLDLEHVENRESQGIESALLGVYQAWVMDRPALAKRTARQYHSHIGPTGKIVVILEPESGVDISQISISDLQALNTDILAQSNSLMRVAVPISILPRLTDIPGIGFVRTPMKPNLNRITSEGVVNTQATTVHALGIRGSGVKVGIIDIEFGKALEARAQGDLPSTWRYFDYTNEGIYTGDVHGTGCAEIVHDMAPDAELALIKVGDLVDFENAKDMAIREGIDILSFSASWLGSGFGDGLGSACNTVNDAFDNDILWINGAGNYATKLYSGLHTDSDADGADGWHNFEGDDEVLTLMDVTVGDEIEIWLTWNDFPRTSQNYDLVLTKSKADGTVDIIEKSDTFQRNSRPVEHIVYKVTESGRYGVSVWKSQNARATLIKIFSSNHDFEGIESIRGSIGVPADARGSLAVGAIPHRRWQTGPQESFSSQGPTIDGRIKPDIMGPDGVNTFSYGSDGFFGTSAAAPHIAGAAALIKSSNPENFTAQILRHKLLEATVDLGERGKDNIYGEGRLDLSLLNLQPRVDVSNVVLSLDLITDGGAGNQIDNRVTSGTVSGRDTKIAVEVFAKGVTTSLVGVKIEFDFDASILKFEKAENSAFSFVIPEATGANLASTVPVTLPESGFLARAEFSTVADVTDKEFSLGIKQVTLAERAELDNQATITTANMIVFNKPASSEFAGMLLHLDTQIETPAAQSNTMTIPEQKAGDTIQLQLFVPMAEGKQTYGYEIELDLPGKTFSNYIGSISGKDFTGASLFPTPGRPILSSLLISTPVVPANGYLGQIDLQVINTLEAETTLIVKAASMAGLNRQQAPLDVSNAVITFTVISHPGDFDGDLDVDFSDFLAFVGVFGSSSSDASYDARMDMNNDGIINFSDFLIFVSNFGKEVSSPGNGGEATLVVIPDANLRAVIENNLSKARGAPITRVEMATLTRLDASDTNIRDLTGLEFATGLTWLDLSGNNISNTSLSGLTDLTWLYLNNCSISNTSLSGLTDLTWLYLNDSNISNISLSGLTDLTWLYLNNSSISDISLSGLTNLTWLYLNNSNISDISPLSGLSDLTWLYLNNSNISDISPLSSLSDLIGLYLNNNSISDIAPLVANRGLSYGDVVEVRNNPLSATSINTHIPALQSRGVRVEF